MSNNPIQLSLSIYACVYLQFLNINRVMLPKPKVILPHPHINKISYNILIFIRVYLWMFALICTSLSELTSIQVVRQINTVAFVFVPLALVVYFEDRTYIMKFRNYYPIFLTALIATLIILQRSYKFYILMLGVLLFVFLLHLKKQLKDYLLNLQSMQSLNLVFYVFLGIQLSLFLLVDDGIIQLSWSVVFFPFILVQVGLIALILRMVYMDLKSFLNIGFREYKQSQLNTIIYYIITVPFALGSSVSILQLYISSSVLLPFILFVLVIDCAAAIFSSFYLQQAYLAFYHTNYFQYQTLFRTHSRIFVEQYNQNSCNRNVGELMPVCVLCQRDAQVVYFDCGHLAVCSTCDTKNAAKRLKKCIICDQIIQKRCQINLDSKRCRFGYQKKFFIQKKLHKNQYLLVLMSI